MSRHDGRFDAAAEVPVDVSRLAAALEARAVCRSRERQDAIACFLTGSDGWQEAVALLGGAFAPDSAGQRARDE